MDHHLAELEELKVISTLSLVTIKDLTWFLRTAIFALMLEIPDEFTIEPLALYECILGRIESFPKDFSEHVEILLDLKSEEDKKIRLLVNEKKTKN